MKLGEFCFNVYLRWYRAPEIVLSFQNCTKAIDIWSVGCIFAQMLGKEPLFPGKDYVRQLNLILTILGTPDAETLRRVGSPRAQEYIRSLPRMNRVPFHRIYPHATPLALDFLEKLLVFDPSKRLTVEQALEHPYLSTYHYPQDEPTHTPFDFSFESANRLDDLKVMIVDEINTYYTPSRNHLRRQTSHNIIIDPASLPNDREIAHEDVQAQSGTNAMEVDKELERELEHGITPQ